MVRFEVLGPLLLLMLLDSLLKQFLQLGVVYHLPLSLLSGLLQLILVCEEAFFF